MPKLPKIKKVKYPSVIDGRILELDSPTYSIKCPTGGIHFIQLDQFAPPEAVEYAMKELRIKSNNCKILHI